ncbi:nidogen [Anopheles sinensis]|uniref:Nidogen n=1 Tax=Anopheles sinensis TaxID=74873 RepID=A0A084VCW1_ANOSI|nr:nidogen [Anopheles sinensis]
MRTILFTDVEATSIAVDPHQGKLYWSSKTMEKENIEWSNLDGSERKVLIEDPQIIAIDDMKVSMATGELCYSDSGTMKIECIDTRSKRIRTIVENITSAHTMGQVSKTMGID